MKHSEYLSPRPGIVSNISHASAEYVIIMYYMSYVFWGRDITGTGDETQQLQNEKMILRACQTESWFFGGEATTFP